MNAKRLESVILGEFSERVPTGTLSTVKLELLPADLVAHWDRCGLTADWIASYLVREFEATLRETVKNVLSTIVNELLENAVKFCASQSEKIELAAQNYGDFLQIQTRNKATKDGAQKLETTFDELCRTLPDALFKQRIADGGSPETPGIGLLIIKRDYHARVGAMLTADSHGTVDVSVRVELDVSRLNEP